MRELTDMLGQPVKVPAFPRRIVSLVPSQTELLCDLGLRDRLVGITKFCVHPKDVVKGITRVGGTKNINIERLASVRPDLIIGNKEENTQREIEALRVWFPVWMSDVLNLDDALNMIGLVSNLTQTAAEAELLIQNIRTKFKDLEPGKTHVRETALYLIWREPWMAAGSGTFIDDMLKRAGYQNLAPAKRYPLLNRNDIVALNPQNILLSSEPYPFKDEFIPELQALVPNTRIKLVDGEMFSWYGSRLLKAAGYLKEMQS